MPTPPSPLPQTTFAMARASALRGGLWGAERLALFLAALCHDIEHLGVSASFLFRCRNRCSLRTDSILTAVYSVLLFGV